MSCEVVATLKDGDGTTSLKTTHSTGRQPPWGVKKVCPHTQPEPLVFNAPSHPPTTRGYERTRSPWAHTPASLCPSDCVPIQAVINVTQTQDRYGRHRWKPCRSWGERCSLLSPHPLLQSLVTLHCRWQSGGSGMLYTRGDCSQSPTPPSWCPEAWSFCSFNTEQLSVNRTV